MSGCLLSVQIIVIIAIAFVLFMLTIKFSKFIENRLIKNTNICDHELIGDKREIAR